MSEAYLPAAGRDWALPLYDPIVRLLGADAARRALIDQAAIEGKHRVLDVGCGTGTLAVLLERLNPDLEVTGLDPDPKALERARRKAARAASTIRFDEGYSNELPYPDRCFDRVFSSFMFHHLLPEDRLRTLEEALRVLVPSGSLHLLDFERSESEAPGRLAHWLHSSDDLSDNSKPRILAMLSQAGFASSTKVTSGSMLFGLLKTGYYRAIAR